MHEPNLEVGVRVFSNLVVDYLRVQVSPGTAYRVDSRAGVSRQAPSVPGAEAP